MYTVIYSESSSLYGGGSIVMFVRIQVDDGESIKSVLRSQGIELSQVSFVFSGWTTECKDWSKLQQG